jgi:hypothetical protein
MKKNIPVFAINLAERSDRRSHIVTQFENKPEFELYIVSAIKHKIGAIGLWQTMHKIVTKAKDNNDEYIIICEDDHFFKETYNNNLLIEALEKADQQQAALLLGGVSYFEDAVQIDQKLFWLRNFTGTQFVVMFNRFYEKFLNIDFNDGDSIDLKMSHISNNIYCIYPFISTQKEFGYSDVTKKNEQEGVVEEYFKKSEKRLRALSFLRKYFDNLYTPERYEQ